MLRRIVLSIAAVALAACAADHQGYLLRADTGQRSPVVFHDKPNVKMAVSRPPWPTASSAEANSIPSLIRLPRIGKATATLRPKNLEIGVAILKCADDHVVRCNFSRAHEGPGSGHCFDNQGQKFSLNF